MKLRTIIGLISGIIVAVLLFLIYIMGSGKPEELPTYISLSFIFFMIVFVFWQVIGWFYRFMKNDKGE